MIYRFLPQNALRRPLFLLMTILAISFTPGCGNDDDDGGGGGGGPISPYLGCCANVALEASIGEGKIYVPNIFTPNDDGVNDLLFPFANDEIQRVDQFEIRSSAGTVFYSGLNFLPNDPSQGWDGKDANGDPVRGLVAYVVVATNSGGERKGFQGFACVFPCEVEDFPIQNLTDCQFGTQHDGQGEHDPFVPAFEDSCFQ